ncbi:MAG: amidohydrolase family protein [Acidimicrobiales bacterium]|nr:amidohydrolase family protein [Acidimicrobiales bacterium]
MAELSFAAFDADNHYYEAEDAFTRHLDPKMAKRTMQWAEIDGRKRLLVGGKVNRFIPNPTFDPVARPGCLDDYFRGKQSAKDIRAAFGELEPISPAYRDRDARVAMMDQQNLAGTIMFPTLGVGMESSLEHDQEAMLAAFRSFNRWIDDDWGLNFNDRIYGAAYITLANVDWAVEEMEWAVDNGVRVINMRASSVLGSDGARRSLGHPSHDRFWQKVHDAGILVAFHSGDSGYMFLSEYWGLGGEFESFRYSPLRSLLTHSPVSDAMASLLAEGVFDRFPNIRVATIENGSDWVRPLFKKLNKAYGQQQHAFSRHPHETFREHIWVSPYYEDDLFELRDMIGVDHMLFGSDFPHAEGLADPVSFIDDLDGFGADEIEKIMRSNGLSLVQPQG